MLHENTAAPEDIHNTLFNLPIRLTQHIALCHEGNQVAVANVPRFDEESNHFPHLALGAIANHRTLAYFGTDDKRNFQIGYRIFPPRKH